MPSLLDDIGARAERALARADRALATGRAWPLAIFVFALALKLVFVLQSADALYVRVPLMDCRYYDEMAQDIAKGNLVRDEAYFMGPLYPYFLGLVYAIFGRDFLVVRMLQAVGGAATVMFTFLIGRLVFRPSAALLAAFLLAFYGAMTFYETELLMEWMGTLLNCAALWLLVSGRGSPSSARCAGAGAALGLSALARASVLLFAAFVLVWLARGRDGARRRAPALSFAAALVATLVPATVHNAVVSRTWVPVTSNLGVNFYIGNGRDATGSFVVISGTDVFEDLTTRLYVERQTGRDMDPAEVSSYWVGRTFEQMRRAPGRALALMARKVALFFNGYEVPQIESFDLQVREWPWLRVLFVRLWYIVPFAVLGMALTFRRSRAHGLLAGFVLLYAASIVLFFVTGRYRAQVAPVLCLFAGQALMALPGRVARPRALVAYLFAAAALVVATSPGIFAVDATLLEFGEAVHRARRLNRIGAYQPALREIDKAIALYPNETEGYLQRAVIHVEAKNDFKAIEDYQRALKLNDALPAVHYDLAQALRRLNLRAEAAAEYVRATRIDPDMAQAYNNLGITLKEMGRYEDAVVAFRRAIQVAPRYHRAYNNLGACYAESGRLDEAVATFEETIRRFPDYASGYMNLAMARAAQKRPREALAAMRRYAALNPSDAAALEMIRKLEIAARADSAAGGN